MSRIAPALALAAIGVAACGAGRDEPVDRRDEFVALDSAWDVADSAFVRELRAARATYDSLAARLGAMEETMKTAERIELQNQIEIHGQYLRDMVGARFSALYRRDDARVIGSHRKYDSARSEAPYDEWMRELAQIRREQQQLEMRMDHPGELEQAER